MQVIMQRLNKDNNALRGTHHTGDVLYVFVFLDFTQHQISFFGKGRRDRSFYCYVQKTYFYLASSSYLHHF